MTVRRETRRDPETKAVIEFWRIDIGYRHSDGRYERVRRVAQGKTRTQAETEERAIRRSLDSGEYGKSKKEVLQTEETEEKKIPTVSEFGKTFVEVYAQGENKPSEIASKRMIIRLYLAPTIGDKRLDEIGTLDIDQLKVLLLGEAGLSPKTVVNALMVLSRMMKYAVEVGHIDRSPKIRFPKVPVAPFDFLKFEEADTLLETVKEKAPEWYGPIFVTLRTGLRRGELFELRWGDCQLAGKAPHLRISRSFSKGEVVSTKSNRVRTVYLTPETAKYLAGEQQQKKGLVFPGTDGEHMPQNTSDANLRRLCRLTGLREIGWHVMRHTYASHLAMRGVALKVIQEQLGHAEITMTCRYAHLSEDSTASAVAVLDSASDGPRSPKTGQIEASACQTT